MDGQMLPAVIDRAGDWARMPRLVAQAGGGARFAWDELFSAELRNPHTRRAYLHAVLRFLDWCEVHGLELGQITPGWVGMYYDQQPASIPTKKLHLAALKCFFSKLVVRHAVALDPASSVRGDRYHQEVGKTPEISVEQERALLASIRTDSVEGLRDKAIVAILVYTAVRIGAVAGLKVGSFVRDGGLGLLRLIEKGSKCRDIPVRDDLDSYLTEYVEAARLTDAARTPLFRRLTRKTRELTTVPMTTDDMGRMLKRRMREIGLPATLSPHSFRVGAINDLLTQGVPLEEVQHLAGHASPKTTMLYDRRQRRVTRSIVDRISV